MEKQVLGDIEDGLVDVKKARSNYDFGVTPPLTLLISIAAAVLAGADAQLDNLRVTAAGDVGPSSLRVNIVMAGDLKKHGGTKAAERAKKLQAGEGAARE